MILRYVAHNSISEFEKAGWVIKTHLAGHHGDHAVLMMKVQPDDDLERPAVNDRPRKQS